MFTITVTPDHIDRAWAHRGHLDYVPTCHCPIALALKDKFPCTKIMAGGFTVSIGNGSQPLPVNAKTFITQFDSGEPTKGFTFYLKEA